MSVPDYSIEHEMSVIGAMLLSEIAAKEILELLTEKDFYRLGHRLIFRAAKGLAQTGQPIEQITLEEALTLAGNIADIGGPDYLLEIAMFTPSAAHSAHYAERVKFYAGLREDKKNARELMRLAEEGVPEGERDGFKSGLQARSIDSDNRAVIRHVSKCEAADGGCGGVVKSTWPYIDALNYQGGFPRGQVTVVKGESGKGKSTWALSTGLRLALREGCSILYATFADMTSEQINYRLRRAITGFSEPSTLEENLAADNARRSLELIDFDIYDAAEIVGGDTEIETFAAWFKSAQKTAKYDVVFLDYAQEIQTSRQFKTPYEAQAHIARYVRVTAQQTDPAFVVLSQVNSDGQTADSKNWKKICALELMIQDTGARVDKNRFSGKTGMHCPHRFDELRQIYTDR